MKEVVAKARKQGGPFEFGGSKLAKLISKRLNGLLGDDH